MPTYAYECSNCGEQFERVQKFTDPPVTRCPNCKKNKVRRVVQATPIVFKGSGWYITDHRSNTKKSTQNLPSTGDKADKKSDSKADSSDSSAKSDPAKTETKSEAKSESKSSKASSDD